MKDEYILKISKYLESEDYVAIGRLLDDIGKVEAEKDYNYWLIKAMLAKKNNVDRDLFLAIKEGMQISPAEYEMYEYLGDYFVEKNVNKAYLCYEIAYFYCDNEYDETILGKMSDLQGSGKVTVKPVSIVIPSYNCKEMMQGCIESIRNTNPKSSYEIVVVDNASTDGILDWLKEQEDIVLVTNSENAGFPVACNQGINAAKRDNDIFLLNNDTVVPLNAIFWLRMGLYEDGSVGATGSVSNHVVNHQRVEVRYDNYEDYIDWAYTNNVLCENPYEKKLYLIGFALMIKRIVLDKVGLLDERFSPGNYEDNDIGFRINRAGYKVMLCRNSFILHYGHTSFKKDPDAFAKLLYRNRQYFSKKWGGDFDNYLRMRTDLIAAINEESNASIRVLEIGCGCGVTMSRLQYMYPNAVIKGIESTEYVAKMAANYMDVIYGDIEEMELDFEEEYFDYVLFGNSIEQMKEPQVVLNKIKKHMKKNGCIIAALGNMLNISVLLPLLKGNLRYGNEGLLNKKYRHMYTKKEAIKLFISAGINIESIINYKSSGELAEDDKMLYTELKKLPGIVCSEEFEVYQYVFIGRNQ